MRLVRETHNGVMLEKVRVVRDSFTISGVLKVQAGAVGLLASNDRGTCLVDFERHDNQGIYIRPGHAGRLVQDVQFIDLENFGRADPCD